MKAVFTGKDGSMGFKKGKEYQIKTRVKSGFLWVIDLNTGNSCPYGALKPLLDNWRLYSIHEEPVNWDDF